jgi:hypothetical protein
MIFREMFETSNFSYFDGMRIFFGEKISYKMKKTIIIDLTVFFR